LGWEKKEKMMTCKGLKALVCFFYIKQRYISSLVTINCLLSRWPSFNLRWENEHHKIWNSWSLTTMTLSSFNFGLLILYGIKVLALSQLSSNNQDNQVAVLANFTVLIPVNNLQVHTYIHSCMGWGVDAAFS